GRSQAPHPVAQERGSGVAALLRMELRGGQSTILDGGQKRDMVAGPGEHPVGVSLPALRGIRVHEIKTGVAVEAVEELRARAGLDDVPAHVRDHRCVQSGYGSGPLAT